MSDTAIATTGNPTRRQNVLADIQFASVVNDDDLTPSEDESPDELQLELETVQSAIGVSIGQQQTRLISPKTPAAEKAAALDETDGGILFEGWEDALESTTDLKPRPHEEADSDAVEEAVPKRQGQERSNNERDLHNQQPPARLPSPWRAGPKTFNDKKVSDHRTALRHHLQGGRRRASSSGSMAEAVRKYMPFNLPSSISKSYKDLHLSLPSFSAQNLHSDRRPIPRTIDRRRRETFAHGPPPSSIPQHDGSQSSAVQRRRSVSKDETEPPEPPNTAPILQREISDDTASAIVDLPTRASRERPTPKLRRSNSEGSLMVYRTMSTASSLGDDSRFESVQEMVNSRLKAIRDSWQDSSFKLPSPSIPNFNFGSRDDMFRSRNTNLVPKAREVDDSTAHRVNFRVNNIPSASKGPSAKEKRPTPKEGNSDADTHPFFTRALQELEGDLVVLGGYRGSILRSAEPPNRQVWVPIKVGLNLRKVDLEVPLDADADERMEESIIPSGMLTHTGPVDISKRLFKRLKACDNAKNGKLRVHNYGYDWRLSPHFLSQQMISFLESLPCNQPNVPVEKRGALVVAHSLGGLIMRHAINLRPELVAGVVYAGVPQRCVNILGPFRNGDDVLFSSRVLTAQVNFSIRTSYALLPLDGKCFFNKYNKEEYPVDFFDVQTWIDCRLSPCIAAPIPRPEPPKESNFSVSGLMSAMSSAIPTFQNRKSSFSFSKSMSSSTTDNTSATDTARGVADAARNAADKAEEGGMQSAGMEPHMSQNRHSAHPAETSKEPNPATNVTIPYDKAVEYLARVLAETKAFKQELDHVPAHTSSNLYPPIALIYGKSTPTVYGAKVESREAIPRADVYDELAFASGDGVVLARAAMVPEGYSVVRGGAVSSDRGHVTLLGDLEAVGRCLHAVIRARRSGVGSGKPAT